MIAVACLIMELTLTDVTGSTSTGESNERKLIVRPENTAAQYILRCCKHGKGQVHKSHTASSKLNLNLVAIFTV